MRYAKSLLYGVIVDASESSYRDYANWQLRCPKCGEPIYLIGASKRREHTRLAPKSKQIVLVKSAEVRPSFAHFKSLADATCENFNSQISQVDINRFNAKNREQRLKIYNSRFLEIVGYDKDSMRGCFFNAFKKVNNCNNKAAKAVEKSTATDFLGLAVKFNPEIFKEASRMRLEEIKAEENPLNCVDASFVDEAATKSFLIWLNKLDIDMQTIFVGEAISFLKTNACKAIALQLFELAFHRLALHNKNISNLIDVSKVFSKNQEDEQYTKFIHLCVNELIEIFALTDWVGAIKNGEA
ncbi:hypothetical protein [Nostoc sp. GT001]|uniref:hypothetical protein n=1 Tax=Nostoc sp. GT001 TaxID=3056647 RepID=UPI0025AB3842|nr:hypothetical protein [Nostoc sp. GT001]MDM9583090.1 hypothetical protein [Nostoc sp. GT001]